MKNVVIFGGLGFIGTFLARYLIEQSCASKIYLFDFESMNAKHAFRRAMVSSYPQIELMSGDVREPIEWAPEEPIDLIVNLAAVHREPGHKCHEYYECNLLGAENVCNWAERVGCKRMIFSSSIAPYGPSEAIKDEQSIPAPESAYGGSKLAAEKIHQIWQAKNNLRQLLIVRPGVVFGPGEGGNVSRLVKAVKNRYFFYMGNRQTRKAGIYVKELVRAMIWVLDSKKAKLDKVSLVNMSMNPGPSIQEYVEAIAKVADMKILVPSVPSGLLFVLAHLIDFFAKPFAIDHPFSPIRIKKLIRSNNVLPTYLVKEGYEYMYSLEDALLDWKKDCPEEW